MEQFPLTTQGAAALVVQLYSLPNAQLQLEALSAHSNFGEWLLQKFKLDTSQVAFLSGMSLPYLNYMGAQVAYALNHKLEVVLVKPLEKGLRGTKLIETKVTMESSGDGDGNDNANGSVIFEISY